MSNAKAPTRPPAHERVVPCRLCGYDSPHATCGLCGRRRDPAAPAAGDVRGLASIGAGAMAVFQGLRWIAVTRGTKRWLVPPLVLTAIVFGMLAWWLWTQIEPWIDHLRAGSTQLPVDPGFVVKTLAWLFKFKALAWLAKLGSLLSVVLAVGLSTMWVFSIVYEAISGPFLDQVHGTIESRWFGHDPRSTLDRPNAIETRRCLALSVLASAPCLLLLWLAWSRAGFARGALAACAPLPPLAVARRWPEWGRWALWFARVEAATAWVSLKASGVAALVLLCCLPLKLLPFVGLPLFWLVAGFTTAVTLIDIPMERRRWSLAMRWRFFVRHWLAFTSFGLVAGLFFLIPIIGAVLMVPAASVGGLWLICRLDKRALRPGPA